jgi:hypothetical protein
MFFNIKDIDHFHLLKITFKNLLAEFTFYDYILGPYPLFFFPFFFLNWGLNPGPVQTRAISLPLSYILSPYFHL